MVFTELPVVTSVFAASAVATAEGSANDVTDMDVTLNASLATDVDDEGSGFLILLLRNKHADLSSGSFFAFTLAVAVDYSEDAPANVMLVATPPDPLKNIELRCPATTLGRGDEAVATCTCACVRVRVRVLPPSGL